MNHCYNLVNIDEDELDDGGEVASSKKIEKKVDATNAMVRRLGKAAASNQKVLEQLLPQLLSGNAHQQVFGEGLADGSQDPRDIWNRLRRQVSEMGDGAINFAIMRGFLKSLHRATPELAQQFLEDALEDGILGRYYPILESSIHLGEASGGRILRALARKQSPIHMYTALFYGGVSKSALPKALKDVVLEIAAAEDGFRVAIEVLYMRLYDEKQAPEELREAGLTLLERIPFEERDQRSDHRYSRIAKACLHGPDAATVAVQLCAKLKEAVFAHKTHITYFDDLLSTLMSAQPKAVLDTLLTGIEIELEKGLCVDLHAVKTRVFTAASEPALLEWCDEEPAIRYTALASVVPLAKSDEETKEREWFPLALRLLDKAPDRVVVVKRFVSQLKSPASWYMRAASVESHARLLQKLAEYPDPGVVAVVSEELHSFKQRIEELTRSEAVRDRSESDRFE